MRSRLYVGLVGVDKRVCVCECCFVCMGYAVFSAAARVTSVVHVFSGVGVVDLVVASGLRVGGVRRSCFCAFLVRVLYFEMT